jgi:hypothetical protein
LADDILKRLLKRYSEGEVLLSGDQERMKSRECLSVAAFLELSGIEFNSDQIKFSRVDPPDVIFEYFDSSRQKIEKCCFEVTNRLDDDIRWGSLKNAKRNIQDHITSGKTYAEYTDEHGPILKKRMPVDFNEVFSLIKMPIYEKFKRYTERKDRIIQISDIDLLVVVQLRNLFLRADQTINCPDDPIIQSWRSVSFIMEFCCGVIYAAPNSPFILKEIHKRNMIYNSKPELWDDMIKKLGLKF